MASLRMASKALRLPRRLPTATLVIRSISSAPTAPLTTDPLPTTRRPQPSLKESDFPPSSDPQLNGYPELPTTSYQYRPAKGWDDIQERRNIGEPVPEEYEALSMWTPDPPTGVAPKDALRQFGIAVLGFVAFGLLVKATAPEMPVIRREYPYDGLIKELGSIEENKANAESLQDSDE